MVPFHLVVYCIFSYSDFFVNIVFRVILDNLTLSSNDVCGLNHANLVVQSQIGEKSLCLMELHIDLSNRCC